MSELAYQEELEKLRREQFVPGVIHCSKCGFELIRTTLNIATGKATAGNSEIEPCPNGCGPLWPVTWKDYAKSRIEGLDKFNDKLVNRQDTLRNSLKIGIDKCTEISSLGEAHKLVADVVGKIFLSMIDVLDGKYDDELEEGNGY